MLTKEKKEYYIISDYMVRIKPTPRELEKLYSGYAPDYDQNPSTQEFDSFEEAKKAFEKLKPELWYDSYHKNYTFTEFTLEKCVSDEDETEIEYEEIDNKFATFALIDRDNYNEILATDERYARLARLADEDYAELSTEIITV